MTAPTPALAGQFLEADALRSLRRVRVAVRAVLTLAVAASVTANVLHAETSTVGRAIAAWSPLALLLTVELISRVPSGARHRSVVRIATTAVIAGIAAWVSYWHMVDVARAHGESVDSAHLIPLSVDGLVVVASICLIEIAAQLRALTATTTPNAVTAAGAAMAPPSGPVLTAAVGQGGHVRGRASGPPDSAGAGRDGHAPTTEQAQAERGPGRVGQARRSGTAGQVARLRARHPDWTTAQIAARLDVHPSTVRRVLREHTASTRLSTSTSDPTSTASTDATGERAPPRAPARALARARA